VCVCIRERERSICTIPTISVLLLPLQMFRFFLLWTKGLQSSDPLFWWVLLLYWWVIPVFWWVTPLFWWVKPPNSSELKTWLMNRQVVVKISLSYWPFHRRWLTGSLLSLTTKWHGYLPTEWSFIDMETHPLIIWSWNLWVDGWVVFLMETYSLSFDSKLN